MKLFSQVPDEQDDTYKSMEQAEKPKNFFQELIHFAKHRSWKKKVMTVLIVTTSFYVLYDLIFLGHVQQAIISSLEWCTRNPYGAVFSFLGIFVVATLLFVPPALLYFGAGYAFAQMCGGLVPGALAAAMVSFLGSLLGAILAFLRSRYMMRDLVLLFAQRFPLVQALDRAIERKGFRVMFLLRLCPIIPFNGLNYIGGVTKISLEEFSLALVGIIPTILLWAFTGASAQNIADQSVSGEGAQIFMVMLVSFGIGTCIVACILLWNYAQKELQHEIANNGAASWHSYHSNTSSSSANEQADETGDAASVPSQQGTEVQSYFHHPGLLSYVGLTNGIEDKGPEDDRDEDVLWLWA